MNTDREVDIIKLEIEEANDELFREWEESRLGKRGQEDGESERRGEFETQEATTQSYEAPA